MEKGTPRDEVMLQFVQEARNGASHDEITAKIKEHYFPVEVEPDPVAHIRQRLASEVADSVFLLAKFADDVQAQKEAAAAEPLLSGHIWRQGRRRMLPFPSSSPAV